MKHHTIEQNSDKNFYPIVLRILHLQKPRAKIHLFWQWLPGNQALRPFPKSSERSLKGDLFPLYYNSQVGWTTLCNFLFLSVIYKEVSDSFP